MEFKLEVVALALEIWRLSSKHKAINLKSIEYKILEGCLIEHLGWIRISIHPTMTNDEIHFICDSINEVASNYKTLREDYSYDAVKNEFIHKSNKSIKK